MIKFVMKKNSVLIPARIPGLMGTGMRAHGPAHPGWDKERSINRKGIKENKMV
jgi:hypothetical protein